MYWFLGFIVTFTIGGATGVLMSIPAADFQIHNSLFLVAHFHNVIIGGVVFGFFAAFSYWFPKFFGFTLNEKLGKYAFWCWMIGFLVAFLPLYLLGLMGATRRLNHFEEMGWQPLFVVASIGAGIIALGVGFQILQVYVSIKNRDQNRVNADDPWGGRNLEWSTTSPPPFYNFAHTPEVHSRDAYWVQKHAKGGEKPKEYEPIHMPKNTPTGFYIGLLSFLLTFGLIWYMFWLAALSALGILVCLIMRMYEKETEYYVQPDEIESIETRRQRT